MTYSVLDVAIIVLAMIVLSGSAFTIALVNVLRFRREESDRDCADCDTEMDTETVDRTVIDAYRSGYRVGYSDATNGKPFNTTSDADMVG